MKSILLLLASALIGLVSTSTSQAQVPGLLNFQGRVVVNATSFTGTGQFKFALLNGTTGESLWSNDGTSTAGSQPTAAVSLPVLSGLYAVLLGDTTLANMTTIPASVFAGSDVRLRVWFNNGTIGFQQMAPDQRIAAVGYAMLADGVKDGAITTPKLADSAITTAKLADSAITTAKLGAASVTADKIAPGAMTASGIEAAAITASKLATDAVTTDAIAATAIAAVQLALSNYRGKETDSDEADTEQVGDRIKRDTLLKKINTPQRHPARRRRPLALHRRVQHRPPQSLPPPAQPPAKSVTPKATRRRPEDR